MEERSRSNNPKKVPDRKIGGELDRKILSYLLWYGALTIPQLRRLLEKDGFKRSVKTLHMHLWRLRKFNYLESYMFYRESGGTLSAIYTLPYGGKHRAKVHIEKLLEETIPMELWRRATRISRQAKSRGGVPRIQTAFHHETAIKNFLLDIAISNKGVLEFWEDSLRLEYTYTSKKDHKRQKYFLSPDLFFCWRSHAFPEQPFYFFMEMQLSWQPQAKLEERADRYMKLLLSNHMQKELKTPYFPSLLFLLPGQKNDTELNRYAATLRKTLVAQEPDMKKWMEVFRCGMSYAEYFLNSERTIDPAEAIWYDFTKIKSGELHTLASLAPNSVRSKLIELKTRGGIER